MDMISKLVSQYSRKDSLDAIYYVMRYIKQANELEKNPKDIFVDDYRSAPSEKAKDLAISMIEIIEGKFGRKSGDFSNEMFIEVMNFLSLIENGLDAEFSEEEEEAADSMIRSIVIPEIKKGNLPRED